MVMEEETMPLIAASAFVLMFICMSGVQGQNRWSVTYSHSQICAIKGSTVDLRCNYSYPAKIGNTVIEIESLTWFAKGEITAPVNLIVDQDYTGRVEYKNGCTVAIRDVRETDSAIYKMRFRTNHQDGRYTGLPGVNLSVSALELQVIYPKQRQNDALAKMKCKSTCLPDQHLYIWIKNGQEVLAKTSSSFSYMLSDTDHISCAAAGYMEFPSPAVYAPRLPLVSLIPSGEIKEGILLTLTCSSDANPAANYTWFKENEESPSCSRQNFTISNIGQQHTGLYYCEALNRRGSHKSAIHFAVVSRMSFKIMNITKMAVTILLLLILLFVLTFCMRKKKAVDLKSDPQEYKENIELIVDPDYENISALRTFIASQEEEELK